MLSALLQMCEDGGRWSEAAMQQLSDAGYTDALILEGGYGGWGEVRKLFSCSRYQLQACRMSRRWYRHMLQSLQANYRAKKIPSTVFIVTARGAGYVVLLIWRIMKQDTG